MIHPTVSPDSKTSKAKRQTAWARPSSPARFGGFLLAAILAGALAIGGPAAAQEYGDEDLSGIFGGDDSLAPGATPLYPPPTLPPSGPSGSPYDLNQASSPEDVTTPLAETDESVEGEIVQQAPPSEADAQIDPESGPNFDIFQAEDESFKSQAADSAPSPPEAIAPGQPLVGQIKTPPPPPWRRESRETTGTPQAGGPLPDFDASQGRWQQMEVGQFDRPLNAVTPGTS